jgi:hypothetical protein
MGFGSSFFFLLLLLSPREENKQMPETETHVRITPHLGEPLRDCGLTVGQCVVIGAANGGFHTFRVADVEKPFVASADGGSWARGIPELKQVYYTDRNFCIVGTKFCREGNLYEYVENGGDEATVKAIAKPPNAPKPEVSAKEERPKRAATKVTPSSITSSRAAAANRWRGGSGGAPPLPTKAKPSKTPKKVKKLSKACG